MTGSSPPSRGPEAASRAGLVLVFGLVAYLTILTKDLDVGPVPLKVGFLLVALATWFVLRDPRPRLSDFPLGLPVLALGIGVPALWSIVGVFTGADRCQVGTVAPGDLASEASRFGYLLLYFPLSDLLARDLGRGHAMWIAPAFVVAAVTWLLWALLALGSPSWENTTSAYAFEGVFGQQGEVSRVFIGNQVLLLPAIAFLLARVIDRPRAWPEAIGIAVLLTAVYHAHTRGLLLAVAAAFATVLVLRARVSRLEMLARRAWWWLPAVLASLLLLSVLLLSGAVALPGFLSDQSARFRVGQAGFLFDAWEASPLVGFGLGASLSNGFARSAQAPWSFELTYLQLLFQVGVIGLTAVLWPFLAAASRGAKAATAAPPAATSAAAGVATLMGLFLASATNPYLISAYGMLTFALGLMLVDHGLPREVPVARQAQPRARRPPGLVAAGALVLMVCVLVGNELTASRAVDAAAAPLSVAVPAPQAAMQGSFSSRPGCA